MRTIICCLGLLVATSACESTKATRAEPLPSSAAKGVSTAEDTRGLDKLNLSDDDKAILSGFLRTRKATKTALEGGGVGGAASSLLGSPTIGSLAMWFNQVPDVKDNPFTGVARREVQAGRESELTFANLKLNPTVRKALIASGVFDKASLQKLDVESFANGVNLITQVRNLISAALLELNYAGLLVQIDNPWTELDLKIDGTKIGDLEPDPVPQWRRFLVQLSGEIDGNRIVDLSIQAPSASGEPALRYHESIELRRGGTTRLSMTPAAAPTLSIGLQAGQPTGTPVVLAGDTVTLKVESPVESSLTDIAWIELAGASPSAVEGSHVESAVGGSTNVMGLIAWARLRDLVVAEKSGSRGSNSGVIYGDIGGPANPDMLAGGYLNERIIGTGTSITWTPRIESPDTVIVVLARNRNGLWGLAQRDVPVMDLRPGIWPRPLAHIDFNRTIVSDATNLAWTRIGQISVVAGILSNMTFLAVEDDPIRINICTTPFSEAHVPPKSIDVDFGDGQSQTLTTDHIPTQITHAYAQPGRYKLAVTATGIDGLQRTMTSHMRISARPVVAAAPAAESEPEDEDQLSAGQSTAVLFSDAVEHWAALVATALSPKLEQIELSHIHSDLQRPVVDLFDESLVGRFRAAGTSVFERDAIWSEAIANRGALHADRAFAHQDEMLAARESARPVVGYKLIKAGVTVQPVGAGLAVRTADIRAYVRVHDRSTGEIVFAREIDTALSDLVPFSQFDRVPKNAWNDQPEGWMILTVKTPTSEEVDPASVGTATEATDGSHTDDEAAAPTAP